MSDEAFIRVLYQLCLGREVDPTGLQTHLATVSATGDRSMILAGLLGSAEYRVAVTSGRVRGVDHEGRWIEAASP